MLSSLIDASGSIDPTLGIDPMEHGWRGLCYGLLSACIMAPVMEELIFRGFLMNPLLRKWGFWIAAFVTTLLFAISHYYDLYGTISVGLFGFSAAAIYYLTRSLTNTIILHVIYNFTITLPVWLIFHHQA
jgi:membrane protease YdiL (CAAX protease family)